MSDWASRRKSIVIWALVLILTSISFLIFWEFWYTTPVCFDGKKNGDETGIDCGGSCSLICKADVINPVVRWDPRLFEVLPGFWSAIVYVENPNLDAEATYAPYTFTIYGDNNQVLKTIKGATILPRNKTVGIFEGGIAIEGDVRPRKTIFELGSNIVWKKGGEKDEDLKITHTPLLRLDSAPRVEANIKNDGIKDLKNIELVIAVFDGSDNVIATSRTFVERLDKNSNTNIFFTWPKPFELGSKVCENPSDVMLLLDRSGSMASLGTKPPQHLLEAVVAWYQEMP